MSKYSTRLKRRSRRRRQPKAGSGASRSIDLSDGQGCTGESGTIVSLLSTTTYARRDMQAFNAPDSLALIAAPMVNQSDLPFRLLTRRHGATLAYTQMLSPHLLLNDQDYLEFHLRDIRAEFDGSTGLERPVVVQLHGNDPDILVKAARVVQTSCDGIGGYSMHSESSRFAGSYAFLEAI